MTDSTRKSGEMPSVTVIIAHTRDSAAATLDSLGGQSYPHDLLEVILVGAQPAFIDGLSYPFELRYLDCDDSNPSHRRNCGTDAAKGDIVAFIDDDAVALPDWISNAVDLFMADPSLGVVGGPTLLPEGADISDKLTYKISHAGIFGNGHENLHCDTDDFDRLAGYITCCNMHIYRTRLDGEQQFNISVGYGGEDTLFLYQIYRRNDCRILYSLNVAVRHSRGRFGYGYLRSRFRYRINNGMMLWADSGIYLRNRKFTLGVGLGTAALAAAVVKPIALPLIALIHQVFSYGYSVRYLKEDPRLTLYFPPALLIQHVVYYTGIIAGIMSPLLPKRRERIRAIRESLR